MMRILCVAIVAFIGTNLVLTQTYDLTDEEALRTGVFETIINATINGILKNLSDPITIPSVALDFAALNSTLITGKFDLNSVSLAGLKSLVASYIKLDLFSLALNMTLDLSEVNLKTNYDADINLASLLPLYGKGLTTVILDELQLAIQGKATISPLSVSNVSVIFTMNGANFNFNGLLNNPEFSSLINTMLNDNAVPFINNNKVLIGQLVSGLAETILNAILGGNSTKEVYDATLQAVREGPLGQNNFITVLEE